MTEIIGITGAFLLSIYSLPQAIQVWKTKDTNSISLLFLILWFLGIQFMWVYVILNNIESNIIQLPLHINYLFNTVVLIYLLYAKLTNQYE